MATYEPGEGGAFATALKRLFSLRGKTPLQLGGDIQPVVISGHADDIPYAKHYLRGSHGQIRTAGGAGQFSWLWVRPNDPGRLIIVDWVHVSQNVVNKYFVGLLVDPDVQIGAAATIQVKSSDQGSQATDDVVYTTAMVGGALNLSAAFGKNIISVISLASVAQPIFVGPWVLGWTPAGLPWGMVFHGEPANTDLYITFGIRDVPRIT